MNEIADFLRARYAEARELALTASPGPWHANAEHDEVVAADGITVADGFALSGRQLRATVDHIAANDPADVLADLDAKLRMVDLLEYQLGWNADHDRDVTEHEIRTMQSAAREAFRILTQPFAGHPDHKGEEWAP
ncbi:MAG: hypothetical protein HOZ81_04535 [Streptomyces sp.]|nr:hypothetical protein [Streptomyces sp.]